MSHEHDWIETVRQYLYPKLHKSLSSVGLYSMGHLGEAQYVCTFHISEDAVEKDLLHRADWERNPIAAYKVHRDGRESTLSLRLTYQGDTTDREYVEQGMQLHLTFFPSAEGRDGAIDCYAHYEDDWVAAPFAHLRAANFSAKEGVKRTTAYLRNATYFADGDEYTIQE